MTSIVKTFDFIKGSFHENHIDKIGIWNGGLRVSSNAGEQYVSVPMIY